MRGATIPVLQLAGNVSTPLSSIHESCQSFLNSLSRPGPSRPITLGNLLVDYVSISLDNIITLIPTIHLVQTQLFDHASSSSIEKIVEKFFYNLLPRDKKDIPQGVVGKMGYPQTLVVQ